MSVAEWIAEQKEKEDEHSQDDYLDFMDDYDFDDFFTFDYDSFGVHDNYGNNGYSHGSTYDSNSHGG